jgi:hypothetical protein
MPRSGHVRIVPGWAPSDTVGYAEWLMIIADRWGCPELLAKAVTRCNDLVAD